VSPLYFSCKNLATFFSRHSPVLRCHPCLFSREKLTTFFGSSLSPFLHFTRVSPPPAGCHPAPFYLSDLVSPLFFLNFPTNFFSFRCHPWRVSPGVVRPLLAPPPSDASAYGADSWLTDRAQSVMRKGSGHITSTSDYTRSDACRIRFMGAWYHVISDVIRLINDDAGWARVLNRTLIIWDLYVSADIDKYNILPPSLFPLASSISSFPAVLCSN